jgi:hypothetical protein
MKIGTALHLLFYRFYDEIDWDQLITLDWHDGVHTDKSPVYKYFISVCHGITGDMTNEHVVFNIENFCMFAENHFVDIMTNVQDMKKARRLFVPSVSEREFFLRNDEFKIFGTVDRKLVEDGKVIICDYKTGNIPKPVREDVSDTIYTKNAIGHYAPEGNFYLLLYLLREGYRFERRPRKKDGKMQWEMIDSEGKIVSKLVRKEKDYAFLFTGAHEDDPNYYVARKRGNIVSVRAILNGLEEIRSCDEWYREPSLMRCQYCDLFWEECKELVPFEVYRDVREGEEPSQKDILDN